MVAKRTVLTERVWPATKVAEGALDRHIYEIRKALSSVGSPVSIGSVYGEGFVLATVPETGLASPESSAITAYNRSSK